MTRRRFALPLALPLVLGLGLAGIARAEAPILSGAQVIPGFAHPESVLIAGEARFVSNIGAALDPFAKDGDGFISRLDAVGEILALRAVGGLDAPKGMAALDGILYVADIDRVVGFDLVSGAQVFVATLDAPGPLLLNDIAAAEGRLLVTETMGGRLYALEPGGAFSMLAEGIAGANGVIWDAPQGRAIIAGLGADFTGGRLYRWSLAEGLAPLPGTAFGVLDGLAAAADGQLLVSDWIGLAPQPGRLFRVDPQTGTEVPLASPQPIRGPADFALDPSGKALWVPATLDGAVVVLTMPDP